MDTHIWVETPVYNAISNSFILVLVYQSPTAQSAEEEIQKVQFKPQEITIVIGDLSAKLGKEGDGEIFGKFGQETSKNDSNGSRWMIR